MALFWGKFGTAMAGSVEAAMLQSGGDL